MSASERHSGRWDPTTGTTCASASNPLEIAEDWPAGRHGGEIRRASFSPRAKELAPRPGYLILSWRQRSIFNLTESATFPIHRYATALSSGLIESASSTPDSALQHKISRSPIW